MSWKLGAGSDLVLHLHLLPSGKEEKIQSSVGLFFADKPPKRIPIMLRVGMPSIDIAAGVRDYVLEDAFRLPADVHVLSLYPHAHYLCRDMQGYALLPDGTRKPLIHIAAWDFNWQDEYRLEHPLFLPKGTELVMRYTYDNSDQNVRNPNQPPHRVMWGPNSSDEMGDLWFQVLPQNPGDLAVVQAAADRKNREFRVTMSRQALAIRPDDVDALIDMGKLMTEQRKFDDAALYFDRAVHIDPDNAKVHNNAGSLFEARGEPTQARDAYQRAVAINPDFAIAQKNLGMNLALHGELVQGKEHLEHAVRADPYYAEAHMYLGRVLEMLGLPSQAKTAYERALSIRPHSPIANAYFAWLLATCSDAQVRNPEKAIRQATYAANITANANAGILDTLAAAYAADSQFDRAREIAEMALALASNSKNTQLKHDIRRRLELYKQSVSYREGPVY
jgi:Tfp pilus assembly protein PilF